MQINNVYRSEKLSNHIFRIIDVTGVCCYLVIGDEKAALLDCCNGLGNIKEFVHTITDKDVIVILTHGHLDHMGSAALFDEVYMNEKDIPVLKNHGNMNFRVKDITEISNLNITESDLIPTITRNPSPITDNQIFDLGNIHIQMISVPGHTKGMMCPLIEEERTIIFGDACGVSVLLCDEFSTSVGEYRKSLLRLKDYEKNYDIIYRNHGTFSSPKILLDHVIECTDLILNHKDAHIPTEMHGYSLYAAKSLDTKDGNILYSMDKLK